jgi:hypothetical protein
MLTPASHLTFNHSMHFLVLVCVFLLAGCGKTTRPTKSGGGVGAGASTGSSTNPIVTPSTAVTGRISSVNVNGFVIASFPIGAVPRIDQRLNVYRKGLKIGEIKISGPQENNHIAADITAGEAQVGDEVRAN